MDTKVARSPREFTKQVIHLIRRELPPRPGQPNDPRLDAAARLVQQGRTVRQVLRLQIPGFERRDAYSRYLAEKGLRAALADRLAKRSLHDETAGAKERPPPRKRWRLLGAKF